MHARMESRSSSFVCAGERTAVDVLNESEFISEPVGRQAEVHLGRCCFRAVGMWHASRSLGRESENLSRLARRTRSSSSYFNPRKAGDDFREQLHSFLYSFVQIFTASSSRSMFQGDSEPAVRTIRLRQQNGQAGRPAGRHRSPMARQRPTSSNTRYISRLSWSPYSRTVI